MSAHCQECRQPLLLQQSQQSLLRESYDQLEDLLRSTATGTAHAKLPSLDEHPLYCFGLSGDASQNSQLAERELRIRDLVG
jgi:hypothetical protein